MKLTEAEREIKRQQRKQFARHFETVWRQLGGPDLEPEYAFSLQRRWRADYCHTATGTIIELEGGIWSNGRHVRGQGYINDCRKYNAAAAAGYAVFRIATGMITPDDLEPIIDRCLGNDTTQARIDAELQADGWPADGQAKDVA